MREMKDSGNVWYGKIPNHWKLNKIKYLTTIRSESAIYNPEEDKYIGLENVNGYSDNVVETDTEYDYSMQSICKKDDILFSKLRPYLAKVFIAKHNSFCTGEFIVFSSFNGDRRYLFYSILNPKFIENINSSTYGAKMPRANPQYIFDQQICLPPLDEQQRIAEFLDRKCGKIDGLKADIQAQIDTLEQYKRSVITEAVTHGLNPSAPMKDSGIPWVGEIPEEWKCLPIRALFVENKNKNKFGKETKALQFKYGKIVPKKNFDPEENYVAETVLNYNIVDCGMIVLNGLNLNFDFVTKRIALVTEKGIITSAYMSFYPLDKNRVLSEYANYLLKSYEHCTAFHNMGGGVRKILNFDEFKRQYFILPPLDEQQEIADYLDNKCTEIEQIIADKKSQIETLDGYKKSLIYEYVTGKKEVI